jgi:hypothetical protein
MRSQLSVRAVSRGEGGEGRAGRESEGEGDESPRTHHVRAGACVFSRTHGRIRGDALMCPLGRMVAFMGTRSCRRGCTVASSRTQIVLPHVTLKRML